LSLQISFFSWLRAKAYITCSIKPFLIKGKQSKLVSNAFPCKTSFSRNFNYASLFIQVKSTLKKYILPLKLSSKKLNLPLKLSSKKLNLPLKLSSKKLNLSDQQDRKQKVISHSQ
jgi:hypothetical protein